MASDWFEIYNTSNDTVNIPASTYFCTDDPLIKSKFILPALSIQPNSFQMIWCDSKDTVVEDVHTNFNLKSSGEFIGLYYLNGVDTTTIDEHYFGAQVVGQSEGRYKDGEEKYSSVRFSIVDIYGREVYSESVKNGTTAINISELSVGVYFGMLQCDENIRAVKFVKQ